MLILPPEFSEHLSFIVLNYRAIITESFSLVQHVTGPTPNRGHRLDLVFTVCLSINSLTLEDVFVSDHLCVKFDSLFHIAQKNIKTTQSSRILNEHSASKFSFNFSTGLLYHNSYESSNPHILLNGFNDTCQTTLDIIAPIKTRMISPVNTSLWVDERLRELKRLC